MSLHHPLVPLVNTTIVNTTMVITILGRGLLFRIDLALYPSVIEKWFVIYKLVKEDDRIPSDGYFK